jgi:hypothetical protein
MALINQPPQTPVDQAGAVSQGWATFFSAVFSILDALTMSGTTANRPTRFLWVGRPYYDRTLNAGVGLPIYYTGTGAVWITAAGAVA